MIQSMTAFATAKGAIPGHDWTWDLRSVNGKGLDLRLRVPDWIEGLDPALRARLGQVLARGNVSLTLRLSSADASGQVAVNPDRLEDVLRAMALVEDRAMSSGLSLAPATAADILTLRGVLEAGTGESDSTALCAALLADFEPLLTDFLAMRATEGAALAQILHAQLDEIARLTQAAQDLLAQRSADIARAHQTALSRLRDSATDLDPARLAQELALLAVKLDVTEEFDRLRAHVRAARTLLESGAPVGRKIDFLSQEFNREANTLCSKAQHSGLTEIGLSLKTVIDQMREQVQNVE
ncbi:YicC family protein [Roseovarius mucosus]|uniref:YicC/YloC family endoribonuclease n=1 Tax=Roseovarius mucosus TaxID=215743 RepID=UPI001C605740|nr:YicC/YloC family endoribonuclease [Roseovarius mucosus]MBW4975044.1 YicC family protein [Roseovarius mucosus]